MHRKQMGFDQGALPRAAARRGLGAGRIQLQPHEGKSSVGNRSSWTSCASRGEAKKDFCDHMRIRTDYPMQSLKVWVGRDIKANRRSGSRCVAGLYAAGFAAAHQSHLWVFVREEAGRAGDHSRGLALRNLVHGEYLPRDKEIVEFEQRAYDAQGSDWNNEVFPPIRDLRGVLARCGKPIE